jgi:hypothetical protein
MRAWRVHEFGSPGVMTSDGGVLPFAEAREAHLMLEGLRPQPKGKIVLAVGSG